MTTPKTTPELTGGVKWAFDNAVEYDLAVSKREGVSPLPEEYLLKLVLPIITAAHSQGRQEERERVLNILYEESIACFMPESVFVRLRKRISEGVTNAH